MGNKSILKLFLCIGNQTIENRIKNLNCKIVDSNSNLKEVLSLLEYMEVDLLVINRLLDNEYGEKLTDIAVEARKKNIKIIVLMNSYEEAAEKKLISALVSRDVNVFIKFSEIDDKLQNNIDNYPVEFSFDLLSSKKVVENEKVVSIEKRVEVVKEVKIREMDRCSISVISAASNGKTFITWNMERLFSSNEYNTAFIEIDDRFSANSLYRLFKDKFINLNTVGSVGLNELSIDLGDNRTVYTNTYSNIKDSISQKNLEELIIRSKSSHEIIIIDTSTNNINNTLQAVKLSDKVVFIFDLIMYNIKKNLDLLKTIFKIYNKENIIIIINNYVECNTAKQLESILDDLELKKIIKLSPVPGEDIYDIIGTDTIPIDRSKQLKEEMEELMNCISARKISNNTSNARAKILKIAMVVGVILFIILLINNHKAISNNFIKLYKVVKDFLNNTITNS